MLATIFHSPRTRPARKQPARDGGQRPGQPARDRRADAVPGFSAAVSSRSCSSETPGPEPGVHRRRLPEQMAAVAVASRLQAGTSGRVQPCSGSRRPRPSGADPVRPLRLRSTQARVPAGFTANPAFIGTRSAVGLSYQPIGDRPRADRHGSAPGRLQRARDRHPLMFWGRRPGLVCCRPSGHVEDLRKTTRPRVAAGGPVQAKRDPAAGDRVSARGVIRGARKGDAACARSAFASTTEARRSRLSARAWDELAAQVAPGCGRRWSTPFAGCALPERGRYASFEIAEVGSAAGSPRARIRIVPGARRATRRPSS
jgi:hypothetical protein